MTLTKKLIKEEVEEFLPSMPRYKKIKLITTLIVSYKRVLEAASILDEPVPNEPSPSHCDIQDDYLILRDQDGGSIADVYLGEDKTMLNHIVFESGNEITEHTKWLYKGAELIDGHYIQDCQCEHCSAYRAELLLQSETDHLTRNSDRVLNVPTIGGLKIHGVTEELLDRLRDSTIAPETTSGPKIVGHFPMTRDGNTSTRNT